MVEPAAPPEPAAPTTPAPQAPAARPYSLHAIHTMRTAQLMTLALSQMADQKASILMGASFVVFSLAVGRSLSGDIAWPLAILALFAFLSALCAAIAVMPSVRQKRAGAAHGNRLFFGHFAERDEEEWMRDILAELHDDERVFRLMLHDVYQNGQVLQRRKYRYLGYAYRLFIVGLVVTLIACSIEMLAR